MAADAAARDPDEYGLGPLVATDLPRLDLLAGERLAPLSAALVRGEQRELLAPLRHLTPGTLPAAIAPAGNEPAPLDRSALAEGLAIANRSYGHPKATELAAKLADPATRVVVTGQQPGLFGGPLYTLSKALAAARWAEALEAAALEERAIEAAAPEARNGDTPGQPAVAVFWVATEDHDFREVATTTVLGPDGPLTLTLGDDSQPLLPVGMRSLGPGVEEILATLREQLPGDRYSDWLDEVGRWYRPDARFGESFCRLLVRLLGDRCPLILDAMLPAVKVAQQPWLRQLVEQRHTVARKIAEHEANVEAAGFPLQVAAQGPATDPEPESSIVSPLFLLHQGERRRIEWQGEDRFSLRGSDEPARPVAELLQLLDDNPLLVSPGVLARPAVQDAILGTTLMVLGPAELAYMTQASACHKILGLDAQNRPAPWVTLRPQIAVLEPRHLNWLEELGLRLPQLLGDRETLNAELARRHGADFVAPMQKRILALLEELRDAAIAVDPNLLSSWKKTRGQVEKALGMFQGRIHQAAARADETRNQRLDNLRDTLLPAGKGQERLISCIHFPGKYGDDFVEACWLQLDLDPRQLQVVQSVPPRGKQP